MKNLLLRFLSGFTHPKRQIDRIISGSGWSQLASVLLVFVLLWALGYGASYIIDSKKTPPINNEMDSRFWSVVAQMMDPGNMHMVGNENQSEADTLLLLKSGTNQLAGKEKSESADTIMVTKKISLSNANNERKHSIWWLRFFVFIITFTGSIAFGGLLISTFSNIFERRIDKIKEGLINYRFRNHFVVIGFDQMAIGLIKQLLLKDNQHSVVLHSIQNIPDVRKSLFSQLNPIDKRRVIFLHGSRDLASEMKRLCLKRSKEIYILGEPNEYDHDAKNILCYNLIDDHLIGSKAILIDCHLLFENTTTYTAFQFLNFKQQDSEKLNLISFNFYEKWAQKVFQNGIYQTHNINEKDIEYIQLDYENIDENSNKAVHLVVVGMTRMGIALGIEAARLGHYANHEKKKTRITFIDAAADEKEHQFANCYPSFYDAIDIYRENVLTDKKKFKTGSLSFLNIEMEFITGKIESPEIRQKLAEWATDKNQVLTVAICFNYPPFSLSQGMYLPKEVYTEKIQILVRQESSYVILNMLREDKKVTNKYENVIPFGMLDRCIDLNNDLIPKYINHYYWHFDHKEISYPHDTIESKWIGLKERDKSSNRFNANSFKTKMRAINWDEKSEFSSEQIELLAKMEHARWNIERLIAGFSPASPLEIKESIQTADLAWKAYVASDGNHKNKEYDDLKKAHEKTANTYKSKMAHPCIIPYHELSEYYKNIDRKLVKCIPEITKITYGKTT